MKTAKPKERDVMRLIQDWLNANRLFFVRMNTFSGRVQSGAWMRQGRVGMSDLVVMRRKKILCLDDRIPAFDIIWLEAKREGKKQSPEQKRFQAEVEAEGHKYFVVRDIPDLEAAFK